MCATQSIAFAANVAEVYTETVIATTEKTILIPVKIKNNMGIMGFKITAAYDKSVLSSPKVTKGNLTENGMMNDSIGVAPDGTFDVVWNGTENATGDGTLMILSFKAVDLKDTQIKLSYSQPDTFNEAWEDVELECTDITVKFSSDEEVIQSDTPPDTTNQTATPPSSEEIKNAVEIVLGETDKGHIYEIPEEEEWDFVDSTNEILKQLTGGTNKPFENVEEIKGAYDDAFAEEFVDDTKDAVDSDKIDASINDALDSVGAESIEQIPEGKKDEFVQKVESNIAQYAPDVDTVSDKLTADEAVEAIKQLQSENKVAATEGKKVPEPQAKINTATVVIVVAAILVAATAITVAVVNIKHKKNEEAK